MSHIDYGPQAIRRRRSPAPVPRRRIVKVKFTDAEFVVVSEAAGRERMTVATYLAVQVMARDRWTEVDDAGPRVTAIRELMRTHRQLRGACTNLNQLTRAGHIPGAVVSAERVAAVVSELRQTTRRINEVVGRL